MYSYVQFYPNSSYLYVFGSDLRFFTFSLSENKIIRQVLVVSCFVFSRAVKKVFVAYFVIILLIYRRNICYLAEIS